jgi:putative phage-type endonuclease
MLDELEELEDIIDTLVFEDEPPLFTSEYAIDFIETSMLLMDEYIKDNPDIISEPEFHDILLEEIKDIMYIQIEDYINKSYNRDDIEQDIDDMIEEAFILFINSFYPKDSIEYKVFDPSEFFEEENIIENKIQRLREIPQPIQRTEEWYKFRWNLITASNAWKVFESQSTINQLIYEKCKPLKNYNDLNNFEEEVKMVNVNTPLHWGQKYEPLTVMIYENNWNTKVEDFGCIQHPTYKFLGASPDGIIVNKDSDRYGRMLEIKNVVSREINGIPKKEYWVQMQLQMEVCDLNECDFLETKFVEYPDSNTYDNDTSYNNDEDTFDTTIAADGKQKGIIIYFHTKDGSPFYAYKPLNIKTHQQIMDWEEDTIALYQSEKYDYMYIKFIYWKLEVLSCVLVLRNNEWFKNSIAQLEKVWKIIEEERITGYEHRAPVKKQKKESFKPFIDNNQSQGCLLKFNKVIKLDTDTSTL